MCWKNLPFFFSSGDVGGGNGECSALLLSVINQCGDPLILHLPPLPQLALATPAQDPMQIQHIAHPRALTDEQKSSALT